MKSLFALKMLVVVTIFMSACSSNEGKSNFSLSSLVGGEKNAEQAEASPQAGQGKFARPIQVAWTSARAEKCGFFFKPGQLKSYLLTHERKQGASSEQIQKIEQAYNYTRNTISKKLKTIEKYCTRKRVAEIRTDLKRHLAGDFSPNQKPPEKIVENKGLDWDFTRPQDHSTIKIPDDVFSPQG